VQFTFPGKYSLRTFWRPLPCITSRERYLRRVIRVAVAIMLAAAPVLYLGLRFLPREFAIIFSGLGPVLWIGGIVVAACAVKLSEAHMDGKKLGRASGWKFCPHCEYELVGGEDQGACPECGSAYDVAELTRIWTEVYERHEEKGGQ
jgi:hypothetical protein